MRTEGYTITSERANQRVIGYRLRTRAPSIWSPVIAIGPCDRATPAPLGGGKRRPPRKGDFQRIPGIENRRSRQRCLAGADGDGAIQQEYSRQPSYLGSRGPSPGAEATMASVLVIEKDVGVREFVARMLVNALHQARGEDSFLSAAMNLANDRFDLVIMNASAGGFEDQRQLALEAKAIWHCAVMIMSGGTHAPRKVVQYDSFVFLEKPFSADELMLGVEVALTM
jgi:hypothetical protein